MIRKALICAMLAIVAGCLWVVFGTNHSFVTTPSMYPTIPPGSEIFVSAQEEYHVGDVIEFHANGLNWAHRLIEMKPDGSFVTKGDNPENTPDVFVPPVKQNAVIGKVVLAPRFLGFPQLIAHAPGYGLAWLRTELGLTGRILLVAIVALISMVSITGIPRVLRSKRPASLLDAGENKVADAGAEPSQVELAPATSDPLPASRVSLEAVGSRSTT